MEEKARIISLSGGLYTAQTDHDQVFCYAKGSFRKEGLSPVAGDMVLLEREPEKNERGTNSDTRCLISKILPRKNVLIRPPLANLDTLFLVVAVKNPEPELLSIDKLLAIARHNGITPVLVFTKKELDPIRAEELSNLYRKAGFSAFSVTRSEQELTREMLYPAIRGHICALAGASGVGKSTLIHTLFPTLSPETGNISEKTQRGKHTTRQSTLYEISHLIGSEERVYVADTPGFSLLDFERFFFMEKEDLAFTFPEFESHLGQCRYTKCTHQTEDGCKILEEVAKGNIASSRHRSYCTLFAQLSKTKSWEVDKKKTRR